MGINPSGKMSAIAALLLLQAWPVVSTYWTVTSFYELSMSTSHYGTYTDDVFYYTYTTTNTLKSEVTPTLPAASTLSTSSYIYTYDDLTVIYVYLAPGAVDDSDIEPSTTGPYTYDNIMTIFEQPVVYTAPASCPTPFTVTTQTAVDIPEEVQDQYTPTSMATSVATYGDHYTYVTAYLAPNAVTLSSGASTTDFVYSYYIADCRNPTATDDSYYGPTSAGGDSDGGPRSGGSSSDDDDDDAITRALKAWVIVVIVLAVLIVLLFFFGFLENFLWFRRLMLGRSTLRFGTISWIIMSLWVLCFTRKQAARAPEDQARLKQQWDAMSGGTKWRLWWKWGFRHAYPVELLGDPNTPGSAPMVGPPQMQGGMVYPNQPLSDPKNPNATAQPYPGGAPQQYQWTGQPMYQYVQPGQPVQGQYPVQYQGQPPQYPNQMQQQWPGYPMQYQAQQTDQSQLSPQPTGTTLTQTSQVPSPQTPSPPPAQGPHQHPPHQQ